MKHKLALCLFIRPVDGMVLMAISMLGEYINIILRQVKKRPLVIEKERINF